MLIITWKGMHIPPPLNAQISSPEFISLGSIRGNAYTGLS